MRTWLVQARFTSAGLAKIEQEGGTALRTQYEAVTKAMGGKMEAFYFHVSGPYHMTAIMKGLDGVDGAAAGWAGYLAVHRGDLVSIDTHELVECAVVDEGAKLAKRMAGAG